MAKWQRVRINIPKGYTPTERVAIANEIIEFSIKRSKSGKDVNGDNFPKYTKEYINSKNFKIANKSSGNVDLELSGEMLNSQELISHQNGSLLIGYDRGDSDLNGKVEGNRIGSYGKKNANPEDARDFLGISDSDLEKILKKFPKRTEKQKESTKQKAIDIVTALRAGRDEVDGN